METLGPISAEINSPSSSATSESDCSPWIQTGFPSESEKTSFTALSAPSPSDRALNSPGLHRLAAVRSEVSFLQYLAEPSRPYSEGRRVPGDSCILDHVVLSWWQ